MNPDCDLGYTGKFSTEKAPPPYDSYAEDVAAISSALNSSLCGPAVYATPMISSAHAAMGQTAAAWRDGYAADRTFHTTDSPEKRLMEAELRRRQLDKTRKEGTAAKSSS